MLSAGIPVFEQLADSYNRLGEEEEGDPEAHRCLRRLCKVGLEIVQVQAALIGLNEGKKKCYRAAAQLEERLLSEGCPSASAVRRVHSVPSQQGRP